MCCVIGYTGHDMSADKFKEYLMRTVSRGPDDQRVVEGPFGLMGFGRLAIMGLTPEGMQPFYRGADCVVCNGELYGFRFEKEILKRRGYKFTSDCDCEILLPLYYEYGLDMFRHMDAEFALILYDSRKDRLIAARDPIGIRPLFYGYSKSSHKIAFASEMQNLIGWCDDIRPFPIGSYYCDGRFVRYEDIADVPAPMQDEMDTILTNIREKLIAGVEKRLDADAPVGFLLSGGLDSSIISAVAKKYADRRVESNDRDRAWWPQLHSFAIGLKGAPDLAAARKVADHIGTVHHEINYTVQEGLDAVRDVIYYIETYDVTTVRASTPMYLLARVIKSMGIKMVLSGEGADEVFGGYLYFHKAPDARAFHEETVRKISKLHLYDCLRANKSLSAWGVEGRVPFLDKEFLDVAMRINPAAKMAKDGHIEKWILRKAFEDMLPSEIVWRQKEQFSDGVGYNWIDTLKQLTAEAVSDREMEHAAERFPINPPRNKEEYYYRTIFEEHFPSHTAAQCVPSVPSVACSTAEALAWDKAFRDMNEPSGRAVLGVHNTDLTHDTHRPETD